MNLNNFLQKYAHVIALFAVGIALYILMNQQVTSEAAPPPPPPSSAVGQLQEADINIIGEMQRSDQNLIGLLQLQQAGIVGVEQELAEIRHNLARLTPLSTQEKSDWNIGLAEVANHNARLEQIQEELDQHMDAINKLYTVTSKTEIGIRFNNVARSLAWKMSIGDCQKMTDAFDYEVSFAQRKCVKGFDGPNEEAKDGYLVLALMKVASDNGIIIHEDFYFFVTTKEPAMGKKPFESPEFQPTKTGSYYYYFHSWPLGKDQFELLQKEGYPTIK